MTNINKFSRLEENIETTIYEGILKLGYQKDENLSIYYDLDLLNHLLNTTFAQTEACLEYLMDFKTFVNPRFHNLIVLLEKNHFQFIVPKEGIVYIYKHNENNVFLKDLIEIVKSHAFTLEDIISIFEHYSKDYICEKIDNSEFQYVLYFKDTNFDKFKYCFTFDQMGGYYHRLLDFSYKKIIQE